MNPLPAHSRPHTMGNAIYVNLNKGLITGINGRNNNQETYHLIHSCPNLVDSQIILVLPRVSASSVFFFKAFSDCRNKLPEKINKTKECSTNGSKHKLAS